MISSGISLRSYRESLGLSQAKLAELADVLQHRISAFELEKSQLDENDRLKIIEALKNKESLQAILTRKKRYRVSQYQQVEHDDGRCRRHVATAGNREYLQQLSDIATGRYLSCGLTAFSLFSGCGGFSLGFQSAGFHIKGSLEAEPAFREIYRANFPNTKEYGGDITKVSGPDLAEIAATVGNIDVLIGGPPCQGFSLSGKRDVDDPRNALFKHYLRFMKTLAPKVAVLENVKLLTSMKSPAGGYVGDDIIKEFAYCGYQVKHFTVNARDYGVPQHRLRILFVAIRNDLQMQPSLPVAGFAQACDLWTGQPWRTFGDACSDLAYLESGEKDGNDLLHRAVDHPQHAIEWLWDVPEGRSAHDNVDILKRPPSGYNTTYKRQSWAEPGATVQTTFGMISGCRNVHPIATRALTIREAARLQSFLDSFLFNGTNGAIRTSLGNAVPPLLSHAIAKHLKEEVFSVVCKNNQPLN